MNDDLHDDLDPAEREIFRSLAGAHASSRASEERIVGELKRQGLILASGAGRGLRWAKYGGIAAGFLAAFLLGTQVGDLRGERSAFDPVDVPVLQSAPDAPVPSRQASEPIPAEAMLTVFHKDQDPPMDADTESAMDRDSLLGKSLPY
jgi:hypothetical protein